MNKKLNLFFIILFVFSSLAAQDSYKKARESMVQNHLIKKGINDKQVLNAMTQVERHRFVPKEYIPLAYDDKAIPIGYNQSISRPSLVGLMIQALDLNPNSKVLEIGTGSGYQAAVLSEICNSVYTIEIVDKIGKRARRTLHNLHYDNVKVKLGDGYRGWKEHAPYDRIIVTCAPNRIPGDLVHQLAEGGIMIIPLGESSYQRLVLLEKINGRMQEKTIGSVNLDAMVSKKRRKYVMY